MAQIILATHWCSNPSRYSETPELNPEPISLPNFRDIARATGHNLLSSCKNRLNFFHFQIIPRIAALRTTQHQTIFRTRTCLILESCAAIGLWCDEWYSRCLLFGFVSRTDKCTLKCRSFVSSSVDLSEKERVIFGGRGLENITITIRLPASLLAWNLYRGAWAGGEHKDVRLQAKFLLRVLFDSFLAYLKCFNKYINRFGEASEPKLREISEISWLF